MTAIQFVQTAASPQGIAPSAEGQALELIEICGRTAYKSEEKITRDSARSFVLMLKKHGHLSVLEHSNAVLRIAGSAPGVEGHHPPLEAFQESLKACLGSRIGYHRMAHLSAAVGFAVSGNFRAWIDTLEYFREREPRYAVFFQTHLNRFYPSLFHAPERPSEDFSNVTVSLLEEDEQLSALRRDPTSDLPVFVFKFVCDRGITHEVVRHRVLSFTQESTRYVNYGNKGMTVILPEELEPFFDPLSGGFSAQSPLVEMWTQRLETIFRWYQNDLDRGLKPQTARDILPNLLKSEILVSGRWSGWKHFIALRDSAQAHPRIRFIAREVRKYFETLGLSAG
ncbi:FAD-dependent thymidylate synthase [Desulforhabdus sp. TSK]|uniref:FAD-dependent thymidylate synthase n=1 Tax=Desulforhabdus sp. TSK TaxID=2925014 RepID=UPI001FC81B89|nr:FAD-dependent thymidylate synthase [Desulforhabdus sp. TSK]GKT06837.1 hypothetical protein DSTSK_01420 [Desulforhabdus sp. TSK]